MWGSQLYEAALQVHSTLPHLVDEIFQPAHAKGFLQPLNTALDKLGNFLFIDSLVFQNAALSTEVLVCCGSGQKT